MNHVLRVAGPAGRVVRSWFRLTREEQQVLAAVLFLFVLGIGIRAWRRGAAITQTATPVVVSSERSAR